MRLQIHVAAPPQKSILIFDGDCNFCTVWVQRWHHSTGDSVEYVAFQDASVAERFPELPRSGFETAVHLVETDGLVYSGAEAAFRALAHGPHGSFLPELYLRHPIFARLTEGGYRFVAQHRVLFSRLTRIGWGRDVHPSTYTLVRWVFLKGMGVIYLVAFLSIWVQLMGLVGSSGILPATVTMFGYRQEANALKLGWHRYHAVPTLCWFSASDAFLRAHCVAGTTLAFLLLLGIAPAPCLFLLWLVYLSLCVVCREFLSFQWDNLLLETGFLAIFFAPVQILPRLSSAPPPSKLVLWLLRWLLFRLMLSSGLVKLLSGDPTWRNLTALKFHYETQPLPTWVGWYAHQLADPVQRASTLLMFLVELALPFLIFAPRRVRQIPCVGFILLQILILLTGNYCFFNLLTILLCLVLLDDAALLLVVPRKWRPLFQRAQPANDNPPEPAEQPPATTHIAPPASPYRRWPIQVTFPLTCIAVLIPMMQFAALLRFHAPWPSPLMTLYSWVAPLRTFNNYGLFAVMTTNRDEIILQGSNDGKTWVDYEFKYKPGDQKRRPGFVAPHQPRLDWQMWFAALGNYQQNLWFVEFCVRVLNGSPQVLSLLKDNPFPNAPPRYLRAVVYRYHFTGLAERHRTGAWWRREPKGEYVPVLSLKGR